MSIRYDKDADSLRILFKVTKGDLYTIENEKVTVYVDDDDDLSQIVIWDAQAFVAEAIASGVKVDGNVAKKKQSPKPVWEDVDSSMIQAFRYDESKELLDIMFTRTGVYRYFDVPKKVVDGLRDSSSKGSYMRSMIINMYGYEKVRR
ncbi:MAG: KTSC domain-containing protein [Chloroflexota bacterium]